MWINFLRPGMELCPGGINNLMEYCKIKTSVAAPWPEFCEKGHWPRLRIQGRCSGSGLSKVIHEWVRWFTYHKKFKSFLPTCLSLQSSKNYLNTRYIPHPPPLTCFHCCILYCQVVTFRMNYYILYLMVSFWKLGLNPSHHSSSSDQHDFDHFIDAQLLLLLFKVRLLRYNLYIAKWNLHTVKCM